LHLPGLSSLKLQLLRLEYPEASALKALRQPLLGSLRSLQIHGRQAGKIRWAAATTWGLCWEHGKNFGMGKVMVTITMTMTMMMSMTMTMTMTMTMMMMMMMVMVMLMLILPFNCYHVIVCIHANPASCYHRKNLA